MSGETAAEVVIHAPQRAPQPEPELDRQRAIKAVGGAQLRGEFLRCVRRQYCDQRIAGRDVHQQEAHQRDAEHDWDDVDDTPGDISKHESLFLLPFSPCGRRWRAFMRAG
jgi:hypothetical protein